VTYYFLRDLLNSFDSQVQFNRQSGDRSTTATPHGFHVVRKIRPYHRMWKWRPIFQHASFDPTWPQNMTATCRARRAMKAV